MVTLTERDETLLEWLGAVRLADIESVRVMLGALSPERSEVSLRRAQQRVAQLVDAGVMGRAQPRLRAGSLVWVRPTYSGKREPSIFGANAVHDVGVAAVSASLIARGARFELDVRADDAGRQRKDAHQADGVIVAPDGARILLEVELTPKTAPGRYAAIFRDHVRRLESNTIQGVYYYCSAPALRAVRRAIYGQTEPRAAGLVPARWHAAFSEWEAFDRAHQHNGIVAARRARGQAKGAAA